MGGYAKIDKNKIQPSPALAALTGFVSGLNAKKKELQDREDAQNKQAVDWYKAMQEGQYKERMATVAERGATSEENRVQLDTVKVEQANQELITKAKAVGNDIDKLNFEIAKYKNEPLRQKEVMDMKLEYDQFMAKYNGVIETQTYLKKKQIEYGDAGIAGYTGKSYAEIDQMIKETGTQLVQSAETERTKMRIDAQKAIAGMEISARATQGELNRDNDIVLANIRKQESGADTMSPKVKAYNTRLSAYSNGLKTALTGKNTVWDENTIDMFATQYETLQSEAEQLQSDPEIKDNVILPTPITKIPKEVKKWARDKPASFKVGGTPTQATTTPLSSGELRDITKLTTPQMIQQAKSYYKSEEDAYASLIKAGYSNTVALRVLDKLYPKGK